MNRRKALEDTIKISAGLMGLSVISINGCNLKKSDQDIDSKETMNGSADLEKFFSISLAQWSLHRSFNDNSLKAIDFPSIAKNTYEIGAVEYVNTFFFDKSKDQDYLSELKDRCTSEGVKSLLIMCDRLGDLGDPDANERLKAVENHYSWVEAAKFLGCHSIRVNARSSGEFEEQQRLAADGLRKLCEFSSDFDMHVLVENHGGLSSNGKWLTGVMELVDHPMAGTLPDFGNFRIKDEEWYDRYLGVTEMMPYARAVSAKTHDFDEQGNETNTDFTKMINIVMDAGYHGYIGIEYEGNNISEHDGIIATKNLLQKVRKELT